MVTNEAIAATLGAEPVPEAAARELLAQANEGGASDNITLLIVRFDEADRHGRPNRTNRAGRGRGRQAPVARALVGVELVRVPQLTERPPHLLDDLHLFECRVQTIGGGAHRIHHRPPRSLAGEARLLAGATRRFSGFADLLLQLSDGFDRLAVVVADFTRFLGLSPELFGLIPRSFR